MYNKDKRSAYIGAAIGIVGTIVILIYLAIRANT